MMAMGRATMRDEAPDMRGQMGRMAILAVAGLGAVFGTGTIAGILAAYADRGGEPTVKLISLLAAAALLTAAALFLAWRQVKAMSKAAGAPTSRERRNRTVLLVCGALGGAMGALLTLAGPTPFSAFTNDPLPAWFALALAAVIALPVPAISFYWHRHVADEQESAAYAQGALIGLYVFWIGAPVWWLLWRGGLVPAPDMIIIYFATVAVAGAVWMWAKYR